MTAAEAIAALAEFLHIDVADVELVREAETDKPDTVFAGVVRHRPPTDETWWGPSDEQGLVACSFSIGLTRDTRRPYVRLASWGAERPRGKAVLRVEDVPPLAARFLQAYCPLFDGDMPLTHCGGVPASSSVFGSASWVRATDTTALQVSVDLRLEDASVFAYRCWYRTGLTPAAVSEEQAKQIAEEQWRAKYPEQELAYEKASKLLESEFSPTGGPVWMVTYRRGPERGRPGEAGGTEHVWLTIDAVTGAITKAPNFAPPKLTEEEAQRICDEQWLAKWPDEKLEHMSSAVGLDSPESPSHGPVWVISFKRTTEGALPVSSGDRRVAVCIDGLTGEILRAPNLTKPKLSEADAEQVVQGEWVAKHPGEKLGLRSAKALLDSPESPSHGPVWVFTFWHVWDGDPLAAPRTRDVEVVVDGLTGEILEVPDLASKEPKSMKH